MESQLLVPCRLTAHTSNSSANVPQGCTLISCFLSMPSHVIIENQIRVFSFYNKLILFSNNNWYISFVLCVSKVSCYSKFEVGRVPSL